MQNNKSFHFLFTCVFSVFAFVFNAKTIHAYYAKAFRTGMIENFNLFYTSNTNNINGLYSINDIEVGFSKYLWAEF